MIVSSAKYSRLESRYANLVREHNSTVREFNNLLSEWNELVGELNEKGGRSFIDGENKASKLSDGEIKKLLILCHPDKHSGKALANEMTTLLNKLRGELT